MNMARLTGISRRAPTEGVAKGRTRKGHVSKGRADAPGADKYFSKNIIKTEAVAPPLSPFELELHAFFIEIRFLSFSGT
jgi:hypothetical protein